MKRIILSVTNDFVDDQRVHRVATTLSEAGAEVLLVGCLFSDSLPVIDRPYAIHRMKLIFRKGFLFYANFNIRLFFFLLRNKADGLVSNDLDTLPANYFISKIKKIPLIFDSHEYFPEVPELIHRPIVKKIWTGIEKLFLPKIKYGYTVCKSIANIYKNNYQVNFDVVRNLPFRINKNNNFKTLLPVESKKVIIYQGSLNIGRGIELVIDAMKYLENTLFIIAGEGDISKYLKEKVKKSGLENKINFTGKIPLKDLSSFTIQADLGISLEENLGLNYYFALPNKLFDYIQAWVPVLTSDFPEMSAIVKSYNIGLTSNERDPEKLADLLKKMLINEELRSVWKKNLVTAAEELCWENEKEKLLNIFRKAELIENKI